MGPRINWECVLLILAGLNLSRFLGNGSDQGNCRKKGSGSFFRLLPTIRESPDAAAYSALIFASFMIPLVWLGQLESLAEFSEGSHLGVAWASFTALVIFTHAFFRSEGWHVLASLLTVNWILYSIGHLHEIGNELPSLFSQGGFIESFTWFFLGFWLNFFAFFFSSRGLFGDVAPRREKALSESGGMKIHTSCWYLWPLSLP